MVDFKTIQWMIASLHQEVYPREMIQVSTLNPGSIYLITGSRRFTGQEIHRLIVQAALLGPVRVLLGGNRFSFYDIAYALAAETGLYEEILEKHITLSRAETCYQVVELLIETKTSTTLTLVSDLLTTFYDESVSEKEVDQLLFEGIQELRRLSSQAPVVVSAHPRDNRPRLLKVLEKAVNVVEYLSPEPGRSSRQYGLIG